MQRRCLSFLLKTKNFSFSANRDPLNPASGLLLGHSPPRQLPRKDGYHVASLHFKTYAPNLSRMDLAVEFARRTAAALDMPCSNVTHLPTRTERQAVPTGPFVHKKSQETYWRKTHKRMLKIWDTDERVVSVWLQYIAEHALPGVEYSAKQFVWRDVGFGAKLKPVGLSESSDGVQADVSQAATSTEEQIQKASG